MKKYIYLKKKFKNKKEIIVIFVLKKVINIQKNHEMRLNNSII